MEKKTYAGKIGNAGSQKVDALFTTPKGKAAVVKRGADLRTGESKGGKSK